MHKQKITVDSNKKQHGTSDFHDNNKTDVSVPVATRERSSNTNNKVNGVFFLRNGYSREFYEFAIAKYSHGNWRIIKCNGEPISYHSLADVIYICALPKGFNILVPDKHGQFDAAVLAEAVSRMYKNITVPVKLIHSCNRETVPLSSIRVWQEHMNAFIKLCPDYFVRIFRSGTLSGWVNTHLMTKENGRISGGETPSTPSGLTQKDDTRSNKKSRICEESETDATNS